jgi:hypothetical protein
MSWTASPDSGVRYFSGTATYSYTLRAPEEALRYGVHIHLDLGEVRELAQVFVNGKPTEVLWHAPYVADITGNLRSGTNLLEIKVTNLWPNRLIGDKQPPRGLSLSRRNLSTRQIRHCLSPACWGQSISCLSRAIDRQTLAVGGGTLSFSAGTRLRASTMSTNPMDAVRIREKST